MCSLKIFSKPAFPSVDCSLCLAESFQFVVHCRWECKIWNAEESSVEFFQKIKNSANILSSNPTVEYLSKRIKNLNILKQMNGF